MELGTLYFLAVFGKGGSTNEEQRSAYRASMNRSETVDFLAIRSQSVAAFLLNFQL